LPAGLRLWNFLLFLSSEFSLKSNFSGLGILSHRFQKEVDHSLWGMNKTGVQAGEVHLDQDQEGGSFLVYQEENGPGAGVVTRCKFSPGAVFSIVLQGGEWNMPVSRETDLGYL